MSLLVDETQVLGSSTKGDETRLVGSSPVFVPDATMVLSPPTLLRLRRPLAARHSPGRRMRMRPARWRYCRSGEIPVVQDGSVVSAVALPTVSVVS